MASKVSPERESPKTDDLSLLRRMALPVLRYLIPVDQTDIMAKHGYYDVPAAESGSYESSPGTDESSRESAASLRAVIGVSLAHPEATEWTPEMWEEARQLYVDELSSSMGSE